MSDSVVSTTIATPILPGWLQPSTVELRTCLLVVESGPDKGKAFGPIAEHVTIGREPLSDIGLTDRSVSKQHCELSVTDEGVRLRDLGSKNGVYCNKLRVSEATLGDDTLFRVGETTLRVVFGESKNACTRQNLDATGSLVGSSDPMRRLFATMGRVAPLNVPVLLLGETGTGKTVAAKAIHRMSARWDGPFVQVNSAALCSEIVEATLFGHVRGAFTGAHRTTPGIIEQAAGGTVLFDEIGDMPLAIQAKLLTTLETKCVRPIGGECEVPVDFRLICATNRDLAAEVRAGRFRADFFYRIANVDLTLPPLRDRLSDIGMLAEWLVIQVGKRIRESGEESPVAGISPEAVTLLQRYGWPGNVRELENVVARAITAAEGSVLQPEEIRAAMRGLDDELPDAVGTPPPNAGIVPFRHFKTTVLDVQERAYLQQLLALTGGNVTKAAQVSGIARSQLRLVLKKFGM